MQRDYPAGSPQQPRFSRFHGLVIGINKYEAEIHRNLQGCVGDAMAIVKFFTELGAPSENLLCLFDENATRDGILNTFRTHLIENLRIQPNDPIVIFFAGYGDRVPAPKSWNTADGMMEMILPYDVGHTDSSNEYTHGIPALTLWSLLRQLSEAKGNNITVILDSCHSEDGIRRPGWPRNSHDPDAPSIPNELDMQLRKSVPGVQYPGLKDDTTARQTWGSLMTPCPESYIILAACQYDEEADEIPITDTESEELAYAGVFTTTLLGELRKCEMEATTYATLINNLLEARDEQYKTHLHDAFRYQKFQCRGRNQDQFLFSIQPSTSRGKISLIPTGENSIYHVKVGSAHGIVPGTEFRVLWEDLDPTIPPVVLVARDVSPAISQLHPPDANTPPTIPEGAYATVIKHGGQSNIVRIWVDECVKQSKLWREVIDSLDLLPVSWATLPENHDVALLPAGGNIELRGAHMTPGQLVTSHILESSLGSNRLAQILSGVVYFHFHLKTKKNEASIRAQLSMKLVELREKSDVWGDTTYRPKNDVKLLGDSVPAGTVATLHPDPDKVYGIELMNNSQVDLYPYVLYYDFEDYSVGCLYDPPSRNGRAPLQAGKSLAIGYESGSQPFQVYFTNPKSEKEYGAFVLLVFDEWADIGYLQHQSIFEPFSFEAGRKERDFDKSRIWDSVVARVELVKK